jgi:hypothetical protein
MNGKPSDGLFLIPKMSFSLRLDHPIHTGYRATGGFCREEAIMILRKFYVTENSHGEWFRNASDVVRLY